MINRNTINFSSHNVRVHIKSTCYLQPEMVKTRIAQQRSSQATYPEQKCFMHVRKAQKTFQHFYQSIYFIAHTSTAGYIDIRKIFRYLRRIYINLLGYLGRRHIRFSSLFHQLDIRKIPRKSAQSRLRHFI